MRCFLVVFFLFSIGVWADAPSSQRLPSLTSSDYDRSGVGVKSEALFISNYTLTGNTVLSDETLGVVISPFINRYLSYEELAQLRDALTLSYVQRGYISSGAEMPGMNKDNKTLNITIVEGVLDRVAIQNQGRLNESFLRKRLSSLEERVVNVNEIETELQHLQQNKQIARVQSQLLPSDKIGESTLSINIEEADPFSLGLRFSNHNTPSSGSELTELALRHINISGNGDVGTFAFANSEGRSSYDGSYELPISVRASVYAQAQSSRSEIVEEPFDVLEIESESDMYSAGISYRTFQTLHEHFEIFTAINYRTSKSFLLGSPFSFSAGVEDGVAKISALQFGQEWQRSGVKQALALRSIFSFGTKLFGATENRGDAPDGQFTKWLGQAQYVRRFSDANAQLSIVTDFQWTSRPLLGLEKYAIGGHANVRGYRENSFLADKGAFFSMGWHQNIWSKNQSSIGFTPFFDVGYGKEGDFEKSLSSVGLGFEWIFGTFGDMNVYWAKNLDARLEGDDLQDDGIHFSVGLNF